ncbi:hypothetical protein [uncultured Dokdonia sp.]|uniref:hypothetical protein n=1 Tax=uncultured Dokdonia sp. TaxID=575653 RepID=UPI00261703CF|nr:hypothetical protein [uncultured Dokdonia sp.]
MKKLKKLGRTLTSYEKKEINGGLLDSIGGGLFCNPQDILGQNCSTGTSSQPPGSNGFPFPESPGNIPTALNCIVPNNVVCVNGIFTLG